MIVPDLNLLLYAEIDAFPQHVAARAWWEDALNGDRQIGIAPVCLFGFLRIGTSRRVFSEPLRIEGAIERSRAWLEQPLATFLVPGSKYLETAYRLLETTGAGGNLTTDGTIVPATGWAVENDLEVHVIFGSKTRQAGIYIRGSDVERRRFLSVFVLENPGHHLVQLRHVAVKIEPRHVVVVKKSAGNLRRP